MIGIYHYLSLAALLFCIGLYGVLTRRNRGGCPHVSRTHVQCG